MVQYNNYTKVVTHKRLLPKLSSLKQKKTRQRRGGRSREMAQLSKICNGAQTNCTFPDLFNPQTPKSVSSISFRSQLKGSSVSWGLKHCRRKPDCTAGTVKVTPVRVSASVATAEKPSTAPEIVLQPINEISGVVTLPGSKSLSNRILLLAALSEV